MNERVGLRSVRIDLAMSSWFGLHACVVFNPQGEPCEVCPSLPTDLANTVALQGKRGPKGEPGSPGVGQSGPPVSSGPRRRVSLQCLIIWQTYCISYHSEGRSDFCLPQGDVFVFLYFLFFFFFCRSSSRETPDILSKVYSCRKVILETKKII